MADLRQLMGSGLATVRGFGSGASMGLHKYPAAAMMMMLDQMVGNGQLSHREAMDIINQQQQEDRARYPVASYGGEIAGAFVPGAAAARGITSLGGAMRAGAGMGAVQGYNEQQRPMDAATGAALGGALPAAGHAIMQSGLPQRAMTNLSQLMRPQAQALPQAVPQALPPKYMRWKDTGVAGQSQPMHMADDAELDTLYTKLRQTPVKTLINSDEFGPAMDAFRRLPKGDPGRKDALDNLNKLAQKYGYQDMADLQAQSRKISSSSNSSPSGTMAMAEEGFDLYRKKFNEPFIKKLEENIRGKRLRPVLNQLSKDAGFIDYADYVQNTIADPTQRMKQLNSRIMLGDRATINKLLGRDVHNTFSPDDFDLVVEQLRQLDQ